MTTNKMMLCISLNLKQVIGDSDVSALSMISIHFVHNVKMWPAFLNIFFMDFILFFNTLQIKKEVCLDGKLDMKVKNFCFKLFVIYLGDRHNV